VQGFWPIFFLAVILKVPVGLMLYLVYWAAKAEPETEEEPEGGSEDHEFRRWQRQPKRPQGPRRGPHAPDAAPLPDCPPGGRRRVLTPPAPVRAATTGSAGLHERGRAYSG
jgi:hypothetical protein